ncbi:hypothetical protein [Dysgonomonas sp. HGC4]|uniref:hypothetical protein n=1 Tax=Dysgonomonas sp. HGC4 TaxID=1658009 RepID=UPI0006806A39|nr:hypothetical protein [Dysgonomonas sp. HGC4]MBD8348920.1 hypothetical protein [Dysgonomonas sp. HGC4]
MGKKKNLNGLPNSLIQQYFSTMFYYEKGYMADWIWNAANEKSVKDIRIDIINQKVFPQELQITQITSQLHFLQQTIGKELINNGFPDDFIMKAVFEIYISPENRIRKIFGCLAILEDKDGNVYRSRPYAEMAYENNFQVYKPTLSERLSRIFINKS